MNKPPPTGDGPPPDRFGDDHAGDAERETVTTTVELRPDQTLRIGNVRIKALPYQGRQVKVFIDAPRDVRVLREELADRPKR